MNKTNEFTPAQIKAIRKIVRDEMQKMDDEAEKIDEQACHDGFDPFNGI